jgi:hypothetical protein
MVNHYYEQKEFHGMAIVRISPDNDPFISRISDSVLVLAGQQSHQQTLEFLKSSELISELKKAMADVHNLPNKTGQKLFKFKMKLTRPGKRIKTSVTGYNFGDSEILLEITPQNEV